MELRFSAILQILLFPLPEKLRVSLYWKLKTYFKYKPEPKNINQLTAIGKKYKCDKAGPATNYTEKFYYEILKTGEGPSPTMDNTVRLHYHGTLIDGTVFDSSVDRGQPASFPMNGVIKGFSGGLTKTQVGG